MNRTLNAALITVLVLVGTIWIVWRFVLASHYAGMVPAELEIADTVAVHEDFTPFSTEGCGVAVFRMSQALKTRLAADGIAALKNATQARGNEGPYYRYSAWAKTPVPPVWVSEGSWIMCPDIGRGLHRRIVDAARKGGAFFATLPEGELIVIPELELIVFSSNG
ncbi:hypothetical protein E4K72_12835 [Oxalobacteraceae bacterium OM1]|nr:hypothetical protein E4K72_12835 [Oxalobacteraceae bacterium OM1]